MSTESSHQQALRMCQLLIQGQSEITSEGIEEAVNQILQLPMFSETVSREQLIADLEARFTVWTDNARILSSDDQHEKWLSAKKGSIEWKFWNRYELYIGNDLPASAVESIDTITGTILDQIEDPRRDGPWDRRGLVMGSVQSGKTANYTGLICKAADAGYKVIIVLAGLHNNLRSQTQIRIDEGFLGKRANDGIGGNFIPTGVGTLDPSLKANTGTNRNNNGDFSKPVAEQFGIDPGGHPLVFVVKKNKSILEELLGWIKGCADVTDPETGRKVHKHVPLLVIDDEADQASVDTKRQTLTAEGKHDEEHNPTVINSLIRQILSSFTKSAYVGYTATPFANIFIYEKAVTKKEGPDLFPGSFIINLPPPSNYIGPDKVFGIAGNEEAGFKEMPPLPILRTVSDYAVARDEDGNQDPDGEIGENETEGWMPPRLEDRTEHIPRYEDEECIPPSMETAIRSFILATAVRRLREGSSEHNSMLVHVVRYKDVQRRVKIQVSEAVDRIQNRLRNGDGGATPTIIEEFKEIWENDFVSTNKSRAFDLKPFDGGLSLPSWSEIEDILWDVASSLELREINGSAADTLNYQDRGENGLNVIAIGGDKLSRGLTLEGLTVSYFLRASRMYDTLMQMGRWFGYRSRYADVCRLYTSGDLIEWFAHIALAAEELRREFEYMHNTGGTPRNYGHRVRSHPTMLVTSATKMRSGEEMRLSYAGDISETIIFHRDEERIKRNLKNTEDWLSTLEASPEDVRGSYLWKGLGVEKVIEFLDLYKTHADANRARTELIRAYIERQNQQGELKNWSVLLVSSGSASAEYVFPDVGSVGMVKRSEFLDESEDRQKYTIRRLVSPTDEAIDLTRGDPDPDPDKQWERALAMTVRNWENNDSDKKPEDPPTRPGGFEIRSERGKANGLLILYPLDPEKADLDIDIPIMGISISFPTSDSADEISYKVTQTYRNQMD